MVAYCNMFSEIWFKMDEELSIINSNNRNQKVKDFFYNNKKILLAILILIFSSLIIFFGYSEYKDLKENKISNFYNSTVIKYSKKESNKTLNNLIEIINEKNSTYSPLALYFIIDNKLIEDKKQINDLFDILIKKTSLENEIKNLIIYKKALFNSDEVTENELLEILNPLLNSKSVWKSHALYLLAEFFYSKNELQKSKEFFSQILVLEYSNPEILIKTQKRLNRDLSD